LDDETPSYWVEHLATFAVGKSYGLEKPQDGIRKLKQMERSSAIWAQPMVLRLKPNVVSVEDENGEIVEQFPMHLIADPTAHLSTDPRDVYNNILLFVVQEDKRQPRTATPTEMHIFQCNRVSANDVVADLSFYLSGQYSKVRAGRRDTGFVPGTEIPQVNGGGGGSGPGPVINSYTRTESREVLPGLGPGPGPGHRLHQSQSYSHPPPAPLEGPLNGGGAIRVPAIRDDVTDSSDTSDYFERDVNTLNRCFDDIERFVSRIQSAALAQREIEAQRARRRSRSRSKDPGILTLRAQLPGEFEFVDVLQKFKLCFNLLAKLKNHIHDPNAPELLHFLFTPLTVILDASQWGLGRNIAPQVLSPLLTRDAVELLRNCLTSKETDVWMALGDAWRTPPEDWPGALPPPYRPIFADGFMPYGAPAVGGPAPLPIAAPGVEPRRHRSVDNLGLDLDRMSLEKERLDFERDKIEEEKRRVAERERRVWEEERKINEERLRLNDDRRTLLGGDDNRSVISERPPPTFLREPREVSAQSSPVTRPRVERTVPVSVQQTPESPRQKAFLEELRAKRSKIVQVTYDRVGQNPKELTVSKGEYLEVLNDVKKWWECRNIHNRLGYVPHTILAVIQEGDGATRRQVGGSSGVQQPLFVQPGPSSIGPPSSSIQDLRDTSGYGGGRGQLSPNRPGNMILMDDQTPEYIKQRQGKRGEFRYF
jgi:epidermal growth factor receptor kinase substrate 8